MAERPSDDVPGSKRPHEGGFTLIELLAVIVIIGILAAIAVFSVGGLGDKGEASACKVDTRTLEAAEASHFADQREELGVGNYASELRLEGRDPAEPDLDYLREPSTYHDIKLWEDKDRTTPAAVGAVTGLAYDVTVTEKGAEACLPQDVTECVTEDGSVNPALFPPEEGDEVRRCGTGDVRFPF